MYFVVYSKIWLACAMFGWRYSFEVSSVALADTKLMTIKFERLYILSASVKKRIRESVTEPPTHKAFPFECVCVCKFNSFLRYYTAYINSVTAVVWHSASNIYSRYKCLADNARMEYAAPIFLAKNRILYTPHIVFDRLFQLKYTHERGENTLFSCEPYFRNIYI